MRWTEALAVLVGLGVLVACGTRAGTSPPDSIGHVLDGSFVVTAATADGQPRPFVRGTQMQISFAGPQVTVTAGCNTMSGSYGLSGTRLIVKSLSSTEIGCPQPQMTQDAWIAGLFSRPVQYLTGKDAAIISGSVVLALAPRSAVAPDRPLRGTTWVLDTLVDGTVATSVPSDAAGSLVISGGRARISDGCNTGNASVAIDGARLRFTNVVLTVRPCPSASSTAVGAVRAVLDGTDEFVISGGTLRITHGQHGLGFAAAAAG